MKKDLTKIYAEWRKTGEEGQTDYTPFTWDCGEKSVREDFSNYAELDEEITLEEMLELENNY